MTHSIWSCPGCFRLMQYKPVPYFREYKSHLLHETSHPKDGVRLTIEMRPTFGIFLNLTVRHAYAYAVYTKSHMRVSPGLVGGYILKRND